MLGPAHGHQRALHPISARHRPPCPCPIASTPRQHQKAHLDLLGPLHTVFAGMNAVGSGEEPPPRHQHTPAARGDLDSGRLVVVHQEAAPTDGKLPVCTINLPLASHTLPPPSPLHATCLGAHFHPSEGADAIAIHCLVREVPLEVLRDQVSVPGRAVPRTAPWPVASQTGNTSGNQVTSCSAGKKGDQGKSNHLAASHHARPAKAKQGEH